MRPPKIYLASQSPRRKELLIQAGLKFQVYVPSEEELPAPKKHGKVSPQNIVKTIAANKALAAARELEIETKGKSILILAADTLVFHKGKVLTKPVDKKEARKMLATLSANSHQVCTAVSCLYISGGKRNTVTKAFSTKVKFFPLSRDWIDWYVGTGEPMDKAGAYGAQAYGASMIESVTGSYTNVVGLPVGHTVRMIEAITGIPLSSFQNG